MTFNTLIFSITVVFTVICGNFRLVAVSLDGQESNGPKGTQTVNITFREAVFEAVQKYNGLLLRTDWRDGDHGGLRALSSCATERARLGFT